MRIWLGSGLLLLIACSDGTVRSQSISLIAGDSLDFPDPEQPTLQLSCEHGRVAAYLVTGTADEMDTGHPGVKVELDSAPTCSY